MLGAVRKWFQVVRLSVPTTATLPASVATNQAPLSRVYLDGGTPGSLLMAFPGTGNKGVTSTEVSYSGVSDLRAPGTSACARMSMGPKRATLREVVVVGECHAPRKILGGAMLLA